MSRGRFFDIIISVGLVTNRDRSVLVFDRANIEKRKELDSANGAIPLFDIEVFDKTLNAKVASWNMDQTTETSKIVIAFIPRRPPDSRAAGQRHPRVPQLPLALAQVPYLNRDALSRSQPRTGRHWQP